jgi:glycosyltransferase involved in cell wall biosynthesis
MLKLPKVLFVVDVRDWAYDFRARTWRMLLAKNFEIHIIYLKDFYVIKNPLTNAIEIFDNVKKRKVESLFDHKKYDLIYFFYHKALTDTRLSLTEIPREKVCVSINNEKWENAGIDNSFEDYMKGVKCISVCNEYIRKSFLKFNVEIFKVSQAVDSRIFWPMRSNPFPNKDRSQIIVGWCGNPQNPLKNIRELEMACDVLHLKLSIKSNLSQRNLAKWYNNIDICVCTSQAEGGPNMLLEAGACKVPYITTPVGLVREFPSDTVIVVPHFRIDILQEKLSQMADDREMRIQYAEKLFQEIRTNWTYPATIHQICKLLENTIQI